MTRVLGRSLLLLAGVLAGLSSYDIGDLVLAFLAVACAWQGGILVARAEA